MYKAKVAVCSEIRTKHSAQSERHVEFLNVKPWWYVKKPLGFKRLISLPDTILIKCCMKSYMSILVLELSLFVYMLTIGMYSKCQERG